MNAKHAIQNQRVKSHPRLVTVETKSMNKSLLKKASKALYDFFNQSTGRDLDYETWRHIEFRNEREPERRHSVKMGFWP